MESAVQIALIGTVGSVLSSVLAAVAVYLGARNKDKLIEITAKVDGQLSETVALKEAVAFGKGADRQRDKQDMKDAVSAGIKQANGPTEE